MLSPPARATRVEAGHDEVWEVVNCPAWLVLWWNRVGLLRLGASIVWVAQNLLRRWGGLCLEGLSPDKEVKKLYGNRERASAYISWWRAHRHRRQSPRPRPPVS